MSVIEAGCGRFNIGWFMTLAVETGRREVLFMAAMVNICRLPGTIGSEVGRTLGVLSQNEMGMEFCCPQTLTACAKCLGFILKVTQIDAGGFLEDVYMVCIKGLLHLS